MEAQATDLKTAVCHWSLPTTIKIPLWGKRARLMPQNLTFDLFYVSVVVVVLVLMALILLCWILKRERSGSLTEIQVSGGRPTRILKIRAKPDQAQKMLDQLLDRVFVQTDSDRETDVEPTGELEEDFGPGSGLHSEPDQNVVSGRRTRTRHHTAASSSAAQAEQTSGAKRSYLHRGCPTQ